MGSIVSAITNIGGKPKDPNGGGRGLSWSAASPDLQTPVTSDQATAAINSSNGALDQQQSFLNAVNAQNGLANQSQVYGQLQGLANGQGPNPAANQLAQATGQNVANQAALAAGQRGSSANAGLIARQASNQGANLQQQAVGQAATMNSQQQLGALGQLSGLATNQANQQANAVTANTAAQQAQEGQILGGIAAQNNAAVGATTSQNSANSGLASMTAAHQASFFGNLLGSGGGGLGLFAEGGAVQQPKQMMADGGTALKDSSIPLAPGGPQSNVGKYLSNYGSNTSTTVNTTNNQGGAAAAGAKPGGTGGFGNGILSKGAKAAYNGIADLFHSPPPTGTLDSKATMDISGTPGGQGWGAPASGIENGVDSSLGMATTDASGMTAGGVGDTMGGAAAGEGAGAAAGEGAADAAGSDAVGEGIGAALAAEGGKVTKKGMKRFADGGGAEASSGFGKDMKNLGGVGEIVNGVAALLAKGGKVPAMVSPGEQYIPPHDLKKVVKEGKNPLHVGERIPGKPKVKGNSYANDTVPKTLEAGGVVIPNSVMQSKDPAKNAAKFVAATLKQQALKRNK